jgi:hypothetical protein
MTTEKCCFGVFTCFLTHGSFNKVQWQSSPMVFPYHVGLNLLHQPYSGKAANQSMHSGLVVVGAPIIAPIGDSSSELFITRYFSQLLSFANGKPTPYTGDPFSSIYIPVFDSFDTDRKAVASMMAQVFWVRYFEKILPPTDNGITLVLKSCKSEFTMEIHGTSVQFVGEGDLHDRKFDSDMKKTDFQLVESIPDSTKEGLKLDKDLCPMGIEVYPTKVRYIV